MRARAARLDGDAKYPGVAVGVVDAKRNSGREPSSLMFSVSSADSVIIAAPRVLGS